MRAVALALLAAGCAVPACKPAVVHAPQKVVEHTIILHEAPQRGKALLRLYDATLPRQRDLVTHGKAPAIWTLLRLDLDVRRALVPIQDAQERPTDAQIERAITTLGALQNYLGKH
jgi:hypothetical protein